jgi:hypothetical protein
MYIFKNITKKIRHIRENISETKLDKKTVFKTNPGIFTGCIYVQSIFILIDLNFSFDNG